MGGRATGSGLRPIKPSVRTRPALRAFLSEYLGHGDPGFTLRTYTHLMPDSQARARRAVDGVFRKGGDTGDGPQTAQEDGNPS